MLTLSLGNACHTQLKTHPTGLSWFLFRLNKVVPPVGSFLPQNPILCGPVNEYSVFQEFQREYKLFLFESKKCTGQYNSLT